MICTPIVHFSMSRYYCTIVSSEDIVALKNESILRYIKVYSLSLIKNYFIIKPLPSMLNKRDDYLIR